VPSQFPTFHPGGATIRVPRLVRRVSPSGNRRTRRCGVRAGPRGRQSSDRGRRRGSKLKKPLPEWPLQGLRSRNSRARAKDSVRGHLDESQSAGGGGASRKFKGRLTAENSSAEAVIWHEILAPLYGLPPAYSLIGCRFRHLTYSKPDSCAERDHISGRREPPMTRRSRLHPGPRSETHAQKWFILMRLSTSRPSGSPGFLS
jgi:hypothetical protein